jgi:hypothetical protein
MSFIATCVGPSPLISAKHKIKINYLFQECCLNTDICNMERTVLSLYTSSVLGKLKVWIVSHILNLGRRGHTIYQLSKYLKSSLHMWSLFLPSGMLHIMVIMDLLTIRLIKCTYNMHGGIGY